MNKLKVGIAGYGVVGKRRHEIINSHPQLEVVAVCDQRYDVEFIDSSGLLCFTNYEKLLEKPLDILFVCLPNDIAPEVTIKGIEKGLHVFCEKPPGRNVQDIIDVITIEKRYPKLKLKYGFNHRYHDSVRETIKIIKSGELGDIINMRGVYGKSRIIPFSGGWRSKREMAGGGILLDQGIHMVDLMRLFCGDFVEVKSFITNDYWKHDVEDNAYAIMKDAKGRIAMLNSTATQWQHKFSLEISLTKGYIELSGILSGSKSYGEEKIVVGMRNEESNDGQMETKTIKFLQDNSWKDESYEFATAVIEDKSIEFGTSSDALETMKLVYSIYYNDEDWRKRYNIDHPNL